MARKSEVMKAIEELDARIAKHQQEINSLEATKELLEDVVKDNAPKKAKKPAVRKAKTVKAPVVDVVGANASASELFPN